MTDTINTTRLKAFQARLQEVASQPDFDMAAALYIARISTMFRVEYIASALVDQIGSVVLQGPFRGMKLVPVQIGSMLAPKILGTYETEIQHFFADMSRCDRLVDVGSAEGYYAVGCPFAHPHLQTIAFDTSEKAHEICRTAATKNGVLDKIEFRTLCTPDELSELATARTLVLIDIDGGEVDLLCSLPAERFLHAEIIVEVHRVKMTTTEARIIPHFERTHKATIIRQKINDTAQFRFLENASSMERMLAVWEGRQNEAWLHLKPARAFKPEPV